MDMIELVLFESVVTPEQDTPPHDLVGVGIPGLVLPAIDSRESGLPEDVARKDGSRLDIPLLEVDLEFAARKRGSAPDREREGEPSGPGFRLLLRKNQVFFILPEEFQMGCKIAVPDVDILLEVVELHQTKRGADFRGLEIVSDRREDEFGVVRNSLQIHIEPVFDLLRLDKEGRAPAPAPEEFRPCGKLVVVEAKHPPIPRAIDDVRSVKTCGACVAPAAGAPGPKRASERVRGIFDHKKRMFVRYAADRVPIRHVSDRQGDHPRRVRGGALSPDRAQVNIVGPPPHAEKAGTSPFFTWGAT